MSEETAPKGEEKAEDKSKEEEGPPPPEPGKYGKLLEKKKIKVEHLGTDVMGVEMIGIESKDLLKAGEFLRDNKDCQFDLLNSIAGVDMKDYRLSVTHLYSLQTHDSLAIKTRADGEDKVQSLMPVWPAADWHERESFDLMGIIYEGHPDLRRILMPMDWIGHPLRKDYVENDPRLVWNRR